MAVKNAVDAVENGENALWASTPLYIDVELGDNEPAKLAPLISCTR
jgi:hypothetical protein